ncbi:MAG: alpha-ribazole phosphatase, partial [Sporomusa sp.]|nr:alpha-ribazole phosphatase [Sporomusa sp.]
SFNELKQRVLEAFSSCILDHEDETIVLVAHGGIIRILLCDALGIGLDKMWAIRQDSSAISMIEYYDRQAVAALVNDTCHMQ